MTMKQMIGIGAAVLTLPLLLLAMGTFDSQQGYLSAQAESSDIASAGNLDLRKAEASLSSERLATVQTPLKIVEIERVDEDEHDSGLKEDENSGHGDDEHGHGGKGD